jgi:hypothetical protein
MYLWIRAFVNVLDGFVEDFYLENHALISIFDEEKQWSLNNLFYVLVLKFEAKTPPGKSKHSCLTLQLTVGCLVLGSCN